jgi:hypothetical protein
MKAFLMHRDQDFGSKLFLPWNVRDLTQDLDLDTLLQAMAGGDDFLHGVSREALLCGTKNDLQTILYRQESLKDCLDNPMVVREIYDLVVNTIATTKKQTWGITSHYPVVSSQKRSPLYLQCSRKSSMRSI